MSLTIKRMREILDAAPEGSRIFIEADDIDCTYFAKTSEFFDEPAMIWDVNSWIGVDDGYPHNGRLNHKPYIPIESIRAALADHDRTDDVSDIRNHVAPTTIVTDLHVNEALKLNGLG